MKLTLKPGQRRLLGESLREIGVLVLVFVPLDVLLREVRGQPATPFGVPNYLEWLNVLSRDNWIALLFALLGVAFLSFGIKIENLAEENIRSMEQFPEYYEEE